MGKRIYLKVAVAAAVLFAGAAFAQSPAGTENNGGIKPYLQVKPVVGESDTVRVFFSPACSFSRAYMQFFKNLGATLPAEKRFVLTPLVNRGDGVGYAMAFMAVQRFYPRYVDNFIEASFIGVQDKNITTKNWLGIEKIGQAARLPVSLSMLVEHNLDVVKRDVADNLRVRSALQVENTPAVAVSGTYIVTPEFTNGDMQMFSQLVNGVVSMAR